MGDSLRDLELALHTGTGTITNKQEAECERKAGRKTRGLRE
jgi:hypothetical protein